MRLIDGDALLETVEEHVTAVSCCQTVDWSMGKTQMKKQVIEDIRNAPTVRCETCEWYNKEHCCNGESNDCTEGVLKCHVCEHWEPKEEA